LPSPGRHLRAGTPAKPAWLVTINTVLASTGSGLDQSAAWWTRYATKATVDAGSLKGCQGLTSFLKVTGADGDARVDICGKLWAAFWQKLAVFYTFYRLNLLKSTAPQSVWFFLGIPSCNLLPWCQKLVLRLEDGEFIVFEAPLNDITNWNRTTPKGRENSFDFSNKCGSQIWFQIRWPIAREIVILVYVIPSFAIIGSSRLAAWWDTPLMNLVIKFQR
jgi:hypothetical protein